jgi:plastocyanin
MRVSPQRLVPIAVASLVLLLPACGGSSGGGSSAKPGHVDVKDDFFSPSTIDVAVGDTVTWDFTGNATHNVTGPGFDSGNLSKGKTFTHTFNKADTYSYVCTIHTGMTGKVKVS